MAVLVTMAGTLGLVGRAGGAQPRPAITIASWSWEVPTAGSWSVFTVRVRSAADRGFRGDVVLVPVKGGAGTGGSYRSPLRLQPGEERTVTVPLLVTGGRYRAEVHDRNGRRVARGEPVSAQPTGSDWVGLLTDVPTGRAFLPAGASAPFYVSSRFASARDFPADAAMLTGLRAVVIADFDSASLRPAQVQALRDYVGMGGSLVLGSGAAWARTVVPLPEDLAPLRPSSTTVASLAPLADLAAQESQASVVVAAGAIRGGRAVLEGREGLPLVVERTFGGGRVVQLAYDPLSELDNPDPLFVLARHQGLARAGVGLPSPPGSPPAPAPGAGSEAAWSSFEGESPSSRLPLGLAGAALVAYALLVGPVGYRLVRSGGDAGLLWVRVPMMALLVTAAIWAVGRGPWRSDLTVREVQVQQSSPDGRVQVDSYGVLRSHRRATASVELAPGAFASFVPQRAQPRLVPETASAVGLSLPAGNTVAGPDGDEQVRLGGRTLVELGTWAKWETRMLRTSSVARRPPPLEAELRLEGGRVTGTVTNKGAGPVRQLSVRGADGTTARLAPTLAPGASIAVAAVLAPTPSGAATAGSARSRDEATLLRMAAGQSLPGPGQLHLIGLVTAQHELMAGGANPKRAAIAALVATTPILRADALGPGLGAPRLVCACAPSGALLVYDVELPPGLAGPLAVVAAVPPAGSPGAVEVYNWRTSTWRPLPGATGPLEADDVGGGMVRLRVRENGSTTSVRVVNS